MNQRRELWGCTLTTPAMCVANFYLRTKRGEFRLIPLPGGRTRLEGSTWYEFEMYPQDYRTLGSDAVIHRIHRRVLEHIKRLAEG